MPDAKLLCMDDDPAVLRMMTSFFMDHGYSVYPAADGEQGLELFRRVRPDLVLVDLRMPKTDGFAVLETVVRRSPGTPVIVVSGEGEKNDVIRALRLGAWNYYCKPIESYKLLLHAVEQALEKSRLRRQVEAYRKGLEEKLRALVEHFPGFIFTCDPRRHITYMNSALAAHVGREALGGNCFEAVFGDEEGCGACLSEGADEVCRFEKYSRRDGRWYHVVHVPVKDEGGSVRERLIMLYDITDKKKALDALKEQEEYLRRENLTLRASLQERYRFGDIIGRSRAMQEVYETIVNAALSDAGVIIYGESGTGKELVARAIHESGGRKDREMIYVNCGAIPENLIESEFFGYKKGAFTGASVDKRGYLDLADGGTLFLDEVGEIPLSMQVKLLRAIEGGGYTPVGGGGIKRPDVRIIAATNRDLKELVRKGRMRQDFLYRIHIIPIHLPPLRDRREDIPLLAEHFLGRYDQKTSPLLTPALQRALCEYDWPGNVRELQNTIHRYVTLKKLDFMGTCHEPAADGLLAGLDLDVETAAMSDILAAVERAVLERTLRRCRWHRGKTAAALSMAPKTLYRKLKQYGLADSAGA